MVKKATLVILEESLALPALQLFRFLRNDNRGVIKFHELKKRMTKNTHPCHSGRISCIAQPSTIQIPTE